jgi:hypothetical protein
MAGTFTHFVTSDTAKSKRSVIGRELWKLLNGQYNFLLLGAVSPDLPYLSFKPGKTNWADVMHYEKTNSVVVGGHDEMKRRWPNRTKADEASFSWLAGYASHLVADATVHPVVRKIVGDYETHKTEHRACEMTEDSIIFKKYTTAEIKYANFTTILKYCKESEDFHTVMEFWKQLLLKAYPEKGETPAPPLWVTTYSEAIDFAEGDSGVAALFRHIGLGETLIYRTSTEITEEHQDEYSKYYTRVLLPSGSEANFEKDVAQKTITNIATAWKAMYESLNTGSSITEIIKNWNLDTGEDMDSPNKEQTYWA